MTLCSKTILSVGTSLAVSLVVSSVCVSAEFRTSVRGQSVVRPANFQQPVEELDPMRAPWESPVAGSPEAYSSDWLEPCGEGSCSGACSPPCGSCWTFWGSFEFLLWWRTGQNPPPLVTTSPSDVPAEHAGVLGFPDTDILYTTATQSNDARPGGRLTLGVWLDPCQFHGVGARLYSLGESTASYDQSSDVVPVLARPFYNVELDIPDAVLIAYPDFTSGSVSVRSTSRVGGGDVLYRRLFFQSGGRRLDLVAGYQFARIDADLAVFSRLESISSQGSIPLGTVVEVRDSFDTRNAYQAGEIGLWGHMDRGPVVWSLLAKVGLGNMSQRTVIGGQTYTHVPNLPETTTNQGLLALSTNSGAFQRDVFTVSPELALSGAYRLNDCISLTFGYSFLFWNHVAQPSDQIDASINPTQLTGGLTGPARPAFPARDGSYSVHGLNVGVQWTW